MKSLKYMLLAAAGLVATVGCTEITDYPDGRMEFEQIFDNPKLVGGFMNACYADMVSQIAHEYGSHSYLAAATDEAHDIDDATGGAMYKWNMGAVTSGDTPWNVKHSSQNYNYWESYASIRRCNIMVERVETAKIYLDSDRESYRGEARGLRAYYYLTLLKNYGAVPLVLDNTDEAVTDWSTARRATYSQVARQIIKDCLEVVGYDPADHEIKFGGDEVIPANTSLTYVSGASDAAARRMNKAMCCAFMSEAALYAASPLNFVENELEWEPVWGDKIDENGNPVINPVTGEPEQVVVDNVLVQGKGAITWDEAAAICKYALDLCKNNGLKLVDRKPEGDYAKYSYNAYDYYFLSTIDTRGTNDTESILYTATRWNSWQYNGLPTTDGQSRAGACPTQELVDCYETIDGKMPILGYADADHLQPILNPEATSYDPADPYANRDPRMKCTLYYHGARMYPEANTKDDRTIDISPEGAHAVSSTSVRFTRTGYYMRKFISPSSSRNGNNDGWMRTYRLAELYLNYAEAANEAVLASGGGTVPSDARSAVNDVRRRVDMPSLPRSISPEDFRTRVRNERRVELAYEGHRFYDVRRWKILDNTDRVVTGMRVNADGNFERFVVQRRQAYTDKYLRLAIPRDEVTRLITQTGVNFQNPGW